MAALSPKIRTTQCGYTHWCPGCQHMHILPTPKDRSGSGWVYSNMEVRPTASPSFLHRWTEKGHDRVCHYVLTDGVLNFCPDCTHELADKSVSLPDIPTEEMLGTPGCE
jgi:hypothetical protein